MPARSPVLRGASVVGILLLGFAKAGADPQPASEADVASWKARLGSVSEIRVIRTITSESPVPFDTRLPSVYRTSRVIERSFRKNEANRVRDLLGLGGAEVSPDLCRSVPCRKDTSDRSRVSVVLGNKLQTLRLEIMLERGTAHVLDEAGRWACYRLHDRGPALKEFLVAAFPKDPALAASALCMDSTAYVSVAEDSVAAPFIMVEALPEVLSKVTPQYPARAQMLGKAGTVMLNALVGRDGAVKRTAIVEPVSKALDAAAVEAVEQWRFRPAQLNGAPIAVWVAIPVRFRLEP
jgi:TonB family protein